MTAPQRKVIPPWQKQYYAIDVYVFKKRVTKNYITPTDTLKCMFLRSGLACILFAISVTWNLWKDYSTALYNLFFFPIKDLFVL